MAEKGGHRKNLRDQLIRCAIWRKTPRVPKQFLTHCPQWVKNRGMWVNGNGAIAVQMNSSLHSIRDAGKAHQLWVGNWPSGSSCFGLAIGN